MPTDSRKAAGKAGEDAAAAYLATKGYRIIERNWHCRTGEIDIIAQQDDQLIFVEVRSRRSRGTFGTALESVEFRKQAQVRRTAEVYLHSRRQGEASVRFDVIAVQLDAKLLAIEIQHIEHAF